MVICLERGADLHTTQLMPLPLTVSCFSKIQIGLTFLVSAHLGSSGNGSFNGCLLLVVMIQDFCVSRTSSMPQKLHKNVQHLPVTKVHQHMAEEARIHTVHTWHESICLSPLYKNT